MKDDIRNTKAKLTGKLDKLVSQTEQIYLDLGRDYPLLLQELNRSIEESSASAGNMSGGGSLDSIDLVIDEGVRITDQFNSSFTSMYSRDGELFEIIQRGISEMGALADVINNIKEISIEMELISLNAMTVALKSGTAGKAFSFITDELKKLSAQTIRLTDQLTVNGSNQLKSFEEFGKKIEGTREKQNELSSKMESHLKSSFTASSMALKESAEMMTSLSRSSVDIQPLLMRIMQEVQLQDIIRQSIDHIYISLEEFRSIEADWNEEEKLDELAYRKMMPDLCFSVLEDVKREISESSNLFENKSAEVKTILDTLEQKRSDFTQSAFDSSGSLNRSIISMKGESSEKISSLIKDVNESVKKRMEISEGGLSLLKEIIILQRQFQSFEPIITRFHNIIVASRIEVAKQAALGDMRDTVAKMTELTDGINDDINKALDTIKHFLKTTEKTISNYSTVIRKEMPELKALSNRTAENQDRLDEITDSLVDCLRDFRIFTPRFFTLFSETDENRKKLNILTEEITGIESLLTLIRENAAEGFSQLSGEQMSENWTIQNERLNKIIEKFTIFTHKKTASDLAGTVVEAEEVADSGEVTLF